MQFFCPFVISAIKQRQLRYLIFFLWDLSELLHINYFEDCLLFKYLFFIIKAIFCNVFKVNYYMKICTRNLKKQEVLYKSKTATILFSRRYCDHQPRLYFCVFISIQHQNSIENSHYFLYIHIVYIIDITLSKNLKIS